MLPSENLAEADRLMRICNACRYCEGLCAVFPAMERRTTFSSGDLSLLANLCHSCGACYADCQYAPPHEFQVNVPNTFAKLREDTYRAYVWPAALAPLLERNLLALALLSAFSVAGFILGFVAFQDPGALFSAHSGSGSFYVLMPHKAMVALFGAAFLFALFALAMGFRNFWIGTSNPTILPDTVSLRRAAGEAGTLRYLDGGGGGCSGSEDRSHDHRRLFHHLTFYGFLLCLASTSVATLYHYVFGWVAPYSVASLPVLLGTVGGISAVIGTAGLFYEKRRRDPELGGRSPSGMDDAFLAMLFFVNLTGLGLLALRETSAMGLVLAVHLGFVFAFFLTMPYGKFVHGLYRFGALMRNAAEQRTATTG